LSSVFEIKLTPPAWIHGNDGMHKNKMAWFCQITLLTQISLLCHGNGIPWDGHPFDC
jgi:hypothetical protein